MKKGVILFLILCLLVMSTFLLINAQGDKQKPVQNPSAQASQNQRTDEPTSVSTELVIGKTDAPITIIEYGDYKCPKCNDFHQKAGKDIRRDWVDSGKAKIVYRPFPLFGEDSGLALYASFCAAEQGKFTAYHDKMFSYMWDNYFSKGDFDATTQKLFSPEKLGELAGEVGLDRGTFTACAAGRSHADAYNAAVDKAAGDSVQGTPTLIIGGQKIIGPQPYNVYKALLQVQ